MSFSVIVPSKNAANLVACVESVRACEPYAEFVVIDDGLDRSKLSPISGRTFSPILRLEGQKPFIFARNVNIGIRQSLESLVDGVVLLNDDALLKTPGGFSRLAELAQHPDIGIVAPVTNVTGQPLQMPRGIGLRQVPYIAFVCVYIPRRTIDRLGMLDERYCIDYGMEDRDYCEAVNRAGLKVCVYDHVFVDHGKLHSSFRGDPRTPKSYTENLKLFNQKWGIRTSR